MLRHETKHSTEVTRFNRYFIDNKKKEKEKKKMKINIIIINNFNIDNDNNNNSNEDLSHNTDFEIASASLFGNYYILRYYIMR